ncbi:nucleotidyl transferase AbiEii/AbiGii toxin family protein [uncultured Paludibaculum sp.]|uniref:nucleotidyl transferase AbiEii/AbiGii toxin family protein n=1 Tax=uncultured Paludibaculum sp. TaxID=1765020 RepID=UPI002AAADF48|nr:nucleotidyl transferase AbiEii/AbiGii toxin family protein [uncultured Paludibaculum sp.]
MDFAEIRKLAIVALFSDDELFEQIVLKGGNALNLVYGLSSRTSLDLDFSIENDFTDLEDTRRRIFRALKDRFASAGFVVFDESFGPKPEVLGPHQQHWWGGYELKFKLIEAAKHTALASNVENLRRNALVIGPEQQRKFSVDMSKHEYCEGKLEREMDAFTIFVYSPAMIVVEKLRAVCQQMPGYALRTHPTPRARDFYDIWCVINATGIELAEHLELARHMFAAKQVPLRLLAGIASQREFHRPDWPAVTASVSGRVEEFDLYFDFVVEQVSALEALWIE